MREAKNSKLNYTIKKVSVLILHLVALTLFVSGMSMLYCNDNFKKGIAWLNSETYDESQSFTSQVDSDIDTLYSYLRYRDILDYEGNLNYDSIMFSINEGPNMDHDYTVDEIITYAKTHGYTLNQYYAIVSYPQLADTPSPVSKVLVNYKTYSDEQNLSEPGDAYASMDDLIVESLACISKYYEGLQRFDISPSNFKYAVLGIYDTWTNDTSLTVSTINYGRYVVYYSDTHNIDTNLSSIPEHISLKNQIYGSDDGTYTTIIAIDTTYAADDEYRIGYDAYFKQRDMYFIGLMMAGIGVIIMLLTLIILIYMSGKRVTGDSSRFTTSLDTASVELSLLLCGAVIILLLFFNERLGTDLIHVSVPQKNWGFAAKMSSCVIAYLCLLIFLFIPIRQYKSHLLWGRSAIKRLVNELSIYSMSHSYTRLLAINFTLAVLIHTLLLTAAIVVLFTDHTLIMRFVFVALLLALLVFDCIVFHRMYKAKHQHELISIALSRISEGDTDYRLDLDDFTGKNRAVAATVNNISHGLDRALGEQVKSERMKADLITNVSHDIKTPLTSIINYIDLMKREHPADPKICEYLDVLDTKSQHLKTLTEDLVEASKASSGNMQMDMHPIDFVELVEQANGEFEERFASTNLTLISELPDHVITIMADGNHLWRVLENIYTNICKYAATSSRVYIDMAETEQTITMTAKNVSSNPLNISPEELTERFVRGDVSRSTEGSGLGLSIARSLTELQDGVFTIDIDGDLFKVSIQFQKI